MSDDELMALANEYADVAFDKNGRNKEYEFDNYGVIAFARAFAAKEREACAQICESMRPSEQEFDQRFYTACTLCADAIRARGE